MVKIFCLYFPIRRLSNLSKLTLEETRQTKLLLKQLKALDKTINNILLDNNTPSYNKYTSFKDMASMYNDYAKAASKILKLNSIIYTFKIDEMQSWSSTVWPEQKRIMEEVLVATRTLLASLEGNLDYIDDEFDNTVNFINSRLRSVIFKKPEKEKEIQDALESLLIGKGLNKGVDYDRESGKFEFSGREYIPDFIIPKLGLCIEVKLLRIGKKSSIIEEISADITAYNKQYQNQLYIVYDLGAIQDETEFKRDIENSGENIKVLIIKQ